MSTVSDPSRLRATPLAHNLRTPDNPPPAPTLHAPPAIAARYLPEPGGVGAAGRPFERFVRAFIAEVLARAGDEGAGIKRSTVATRMRMGLAGLELYVKPSRHEVIPGDRLLELLSGAVLAGAPETVDWAWSTLARMAGFLAIRAPEPGAEDAELSICELAARVGDLARALTQCRAAGSAGGEFITAGEYRTLGACAHEVARVAVYLCALCEGEAGRRSAVRQ